MRKSRGAHGNIYVLVIYLYICYVYVCTKIKRRKRKEFSNIYIYKNESTKEKGEKKRSLLSAKIEKKKREVK